VCHAACPDGFFRGPVVGELGTVSGGAAVGHDARDAKPRGVTPAGMGGDRDGCGPLGHGRRSHLRGEGEGTDGRGATVAGALEASGPADAGHRPSMDVGGPPGEVGRPVAVWSGVVAPGVRETEPVSLRRGCDGSGSADDDLGPSPGGHLAGADDADGGPAVRRDGCLLCQSLHVQGPPGRRRHADPPVTA